MERENDGDALLNEMQSIIDELRKEGLDESRLRAMVAGAFLAELLR